jgi:hypothetical protein
MQPKTAIILIGAIAIFLTAISLVAILVTSPQTTMPPACLATEMKDGIMLSCSVDKNNYVLVYSPDKELVNYRPEQYPKYFIPGRKISDIRVYEYEGSSGLTPVKIIRG